MKKICLVLAMVLAIALFPVFANGEKEADASNGVADISFMWWGNETRNAATIKAAEDFMKENPSVKVTPMPNPFNGYHDKILVQLANGTVADIFCYSTEWMTEVGFEDNCPLLDLNTVSEYIDFSGIDENLLKGGMANGRLLGVPTAISGQTISFYKNAIDAYVKKSGDKWPAVEGESWTFDDFLAYGKKFHDVMGENYYFLDFGGDWNGFDSVFTWILSEICNSSYIDEKCEIRFTEKDLEKTFDILLEMTEDGVLPSVDFQTEIFSGVSSRDAYLANGQMGSVFHWTSNIQENSVKSNSELVTAAYPILGREENDGIFVRPAQFWSISAKSKNKVAAAQLMNYILNSPTAASDLALERGVPQTKIGRETLAKEGLLSGTIANATDYLIEEADASYNWFVRIPEVLNEINQTWADVLHSKITAQKGAEKLYENLQKIVGNMRKDYNI